MIYLGGNQVVVDLDSRSTHDNPGPFRMVVHNFSRYTDTVQKLPILERIKLVIVSDFIVESFFPGNLPVTGVKLIGHADFDPQRESREPGFLQRISEKRAADVKTELLNRVEHPEWAFEGRKTNARPDQINWLSWGVADREPAEENIKRGRTIANMTEADRKLNRRVEIFLEPAGTPVPPVPPSTDLADVIIKNTENYWRDHLLPVPPGPSPFLDPDFPGPGPRKGNEYLEFVCKLLDRLKDVQEKIHVNLFDSVVGKLTDMLQKGPTTNDWTNTFQTLLDEIKERQRHGDEWWKNDDCPQPPEPPPPVKRPRLIVEPHIVNITRGGHVEVTVTLRGKRPFVGSIPIQLRDLPAKVTFQRGAIPIEFPDFVKILLDAAPDAPVGQAVQCSAETFPEGDLKSDFFIVNVQ